MTTRDFRQDWYVIDAPVDVLEPWVVGVEMDAPFQQEGPHRGGFFRYWGDGKLEYVNRD